MWFPRIDLLKLMLQKILTLMRRNWLARRLLFSSCSCFDWIIRMRKVLLLSVISVISVINYYVSVLVIWLAACSEDKWQIKMKNEASLAFLKIMELWTWDSSTKYNTTIRNYHWGYAQTSQERRRLLLLLLSTTLISNHTMKSCFHAQKNP